MLVKMYKSYMPTVAEAYRQIGSTMVLSQIYDIAVKHNLDSLAGVTKHEMDWRKDPTIQYTLDKISMCKFLQKDSDKISALEELLACAIEYRITLFALCVQATLISFGHKDIAKKLLKQEFEKSNAFLLSEFGGSLMVNLYRDSSDDLLDIENHTFRRFIAEQTAPSLD